MSKLLALAVLSLIATGVTAFNPQQQPLDPLQHSGAWSPYFDAPPQDGIPAALPSGCTVSQAAYLVRHGSRYPEPGSSASWTTLQQKIHNASFASQPTGPLAFLPTWVSPVDDAAHEPLYLSATGAGEGFALGVALRKRYRLTPGGQNFTAWTAGQQRVVDTATYFLRGYLSQGNYLSSPSLNRAHLLTLPDSVNYTSADSLTPSAACPAYTTGDTGAVTANAWRAAYQGRVAERLNKGELRGTGVVLTAGDVGVMQDLCGFSAEIDGDLRFCDVFEPSEWLDYEYAHDLNYYYGSGPGNPLSGTTGFPWVRAVTDLFLLGPNKTTPTGSFTPPPLIMGFSHDNNIPPVIAALGLWGAPLSKTHADPARKFRASHLVSFRGTVALEKMTCGKKGEYVRVSANNAPIRIPGCDSGPGSTCPLAQFAAYVDKRGRVAGDFVQKCGLSAVKNATSVLDVFVNLKGGLATESVVSL
ncbi:hypothetical protein PLICRDRAFT_177012 [Plicaturopsis crispa FD-325 SS-3]|nr:hypothetical protein PLICRDRAFT_177012 [Plicaturopsis crispa FD-325 SS-3]